MSNLFTASRARARAQRILSSRDSAMNLIGASVLRGMVAALVLMAPASVVLADPSPDPITGKYYETRGSFTWDGARVDAAGQVFVGNMGHLATISDMNENSVVQFIGGTIEKWIGLTDSTATSMLDGFDLSLFGTSEQGDTSALPLPAPGVAPVVGERGAGFQWVTGEPYTYLNWRAGAPGDFLSQSDGVHTMPQGVWQDTFAGASVGEPGFGPVLKSYVVEFETALDQQRFNITERKAAGSFNGGTGQVATLADAEALLGLSPGHTDIEQEEQGLGYVLSFQDPDLGGGFEDYVRRPFLVNEFGVDEENVAYLATTKVLIPSAGDWTFATMSGDDFRLTIGGNEFVGDGVFPTGPARLSRLTDGTLTAVPGGSGETFYFPEAGVYDLELLTFQSATFGFIQLFAAPGNEIAFDAATFDLVGDELNGGLRLVPEPSSFAIGILGLTGVAVAGAWKRRRKAHLPTVD